MYRSLRTQVISATIVGVTVVAALASAAWYSTAANLRTEELDLTLELQARTLATLVFWTPAGLELEFSDELMPDFLPGPDPAFFQVWRGDGSVLERSRSLEGDDLRIEPTRLTGATGAFEVVLPSGAPGRAVGLRFEVLEGIPGHPAVDDAAVGFDPPEAMVAVAHGIESLSRARDDLLLRSVLVGAGLVVGAALILFFVLSRGLRPLERFSAEISAIHPSRPPSALAGGRLPLELEPIRARLDELLVRIRATLERERRVASEIAHELRTPIAELRSMTEVALRWPEGDDSHRRSLEVAHDVAVRMAASVDAVLRLARSRTSQADLDVEPIDLMELVRVVWAEMPGPAEGRGRLTTHGDAVVRTDRASLHVILTNLLGNAVRHAAGADVCCEVRSVPRGAQLLISNGLGDVAVGDDGPSSETPSTASSGLGLSIVRSFCEVLGLEFSQHRLEGRWVVDLRFPERASAA